MKSVKRASIYLLLAITLLGCSFLKKPAAKQEVQPTTKAEPTSQSQPDKPPTVQGDLQVGQASGSYTAKGEVVELKYAYAGHGERFGNESIVILLTDKAIPPDAISEELKSQTLLQSEQLRGLEYVIDKDGMWVRFHPSQYQESSSNKLKDYSVDGNIVRGTDDGGGNLSDGKYGRTVKFVAAFVN